MKYKLNVKDVKSRMTVEMWLDLLASINTYLANAVTSAGKNQHHTCPFCGNRDFRITVKNDVGSICTCSAHSDALSIISALPSVNGFYDALRIASDYLEGNSINSVPSREIQRDNDKTVAQSNKRKHEYIKSLYARSSTTPSDAALLYYKSRGLNAKQIGEFNSVRYVSKVKIKHGNKYLEHDNKILELDLIMLMLSDKNGVGGIIQIYLTANGCPADDLIYKCKLKTDSNAELIKKPMMTFRDVRGCAVRLGSGTGAEYAVCEGFETALAVRQLHGVDNIAACGTAALLASVSIPERVTRLTVYCDNDKNKTGEKFAQKLLEKHNQLSTKIIMPESKLGNKKTVDFADDLLL